MIDQTERLWFIMSNHSDTSAVARRHLDRRFSALDVGVLSPRPPKGWVRAIRDALGLTVRQFGARLGKSHSTVVALEQGEVSGTLTLAGLQKAAAALDCTLHYVLVPNRPLADMVHSRARVVAEARLARIDHTMRLENQGLSEADLAAELDRLTEDYARRGGRRLWDPL
ncbi:mobile mystery protein A [Phenylobacterium sp.]|uniref:mobile mystery protein A n=1 Tax=Phenylobacterium sp. TaxID=1871053 RepID=UPI0035B34260